MKCNACVSPGYVTSSHSNHVESSLSSDDWYITTVLLAKSLGDVQILRQLLRLHTISGVPT